MSKSTSQYLKTILNDRQNTVSKSERDQPFDTLQAQIDPCFQPLSLYDHLVQHKRQKKIGIIGEIKKASPSEGVIQGNVNVSCQAAQYIVGGAVGISVLTEPKWFGGDISHLNMVRKVIDSQGQPTILLRKDFIFCKYQILESLVAKSDSLLLIVSMLRLIWSETDELLEHLTQLLQFARQLGMEPLVEVFDSEEIELSIKAGAKVIGINNRNLNTFTLDTSRCTELIGSVPIEIEVVVLSGIQSVSSTLPFLEARANFFLVGTHLMLSDCPSREVAVLSQRKPLLKICGITNFKDIMQLGHNPGIGMMGLVFAESKRQISTSFAKKIRKYLGPSPIGQSKDSLYEWLPSQDALIYWIQESRRRQSYPLLVGVFGDQSQEEINQIAEDAELDLIQLHGKPSSGEYELSSFCRPVIKALSISVDETDPSQVWKRVRRYIDQNCLLLFDTIKDGQMGGTGVSFPHHLLREFQSKTHPIIAGGLHAGNLRKVMKDMCPWMVDMSSGLEISGSMGKNLRLVDEVIRIL